MSVALPLLVIDTNIVLDVLVFADPAAAALRQALAGQSVGWLATQSMRDELVRVLSYPQIAVRLAAASRYDTQVLGEFDRWSRRVLPASQSAVRCKDRDDQAFIDLAVEHRATLLSKDRQVLRLRSRLAPLGVAVHQRMVF